MERSIAAITPTQMRSIPIFPRVPIFDERCLATPLFGLNKGDSLPGFVREVRDASVQVKLMSGIFGWAHGPGLGLEDDERPCDWYSEGDWVTAEVAGLDHGNACLTLSIRSPRPRSQLMAPMATRFPDSPLDLLQRGSRLWASVREVRKTGLKVVADGVPGWIDREAAGTSEETVLADGYRPGQLIPVWVTGVNHAGGEFTAQLDPLSSPRPAAGNWYGPAR